MESGKNKGKKIVPNWEEVGEMLKYRGWSLTEIGKQKVIYRRGNEAIVARKVLGNKWKAEYFSSRRLLDSTGIETEMYAKILAIEMGVNK